MVWASAGLAPYLIRTETQEPEEFESTDHSLMKATFDLHSHVRPMNQAILAAQRPKDRKLLLEDVDNEAWDSYADQIERSLVDFGGLDNTLQFPEAFQAGAAMKPTETYLKAVRLNHLWEVLRDTIISSAFKHLPSARTGGRPPPPDGEAFILSLIDDLGGIIRSVRVAFVDQQFADRNLKEETRSRISDWYRQNGAEMRLDVVPSVDGTVEEWKEWLGPVQRLWRQARLDHQEYFAANKQDIINAHIENRDLRFQTHTRQTIRGILEVFEGRVNLDHLIVDADSEGPDVASVAPPTSNHGRTFARTGMTR